MRPVTTALIAVSLSLLLVPAGCEQNTDLPPQVIAGAGGGVPVSLPDYVLNDKDTGIKAALPETAQPGDGSDVPGGTPDSSESTVVVNDATPDDVCDTYVTMMNTGDVSRLPEILVAEQQEAVRTLLPGLGPYLRAMQSVRDSWTAKLPDDPFQLSAQAGPASQLGAFWMVAEVQASGDDEAAVTLENEGTGQTTEMVARKEGDVWRVVDPIVDALGTAFANNPGSGQAWVDSIVQAAANLENMAPRIENDEFDDPTAARAAVFQAIAQAGTGMNASSAPPVDNAAPAPPNQADPPVIPTPRNPGQSNRSPRERDPNDPVDNSYSSPGSVLRNR